MRRWLAGLLALWAGAPLAAQGWGRDAPPLELHFLDVGQADAILIRQGRVGVLVDAGRGDDIVLWLEELGIDSLAAAIGSHNHDDHVGGMDAVLADVPVGAYYYNGRAPGNRNAEAVEDLLREEGIPAPPPPWQPVRLGDARITIFPSRLRGAEVSENNSSLGVLVERGRFRALLTGDSEIDELNAWMDAGDIPDVDVLKAAHHGSRDAVTPGWIQRTRPEVVVISVGAGNTYGHPEEAALRYYRTGGRRVLRTDQDGTVTVVVDRAGGYEITTSGPRPR